MMEMELVRQAEASPWGARLSMLRSQDIVV